MSDSAFALLRELVDAEPCEYDHNDLCQAHHLDERPCPHERAKALLDGLPQQDAGHHPALVESGELEIAQRKAIAAAIDVARLGVFDSGDDQIRASVEGYLSAMRRHWHPTAHPIEIGEGDYVTLDVAGARMEVHASVVREADVHIDKSRRWPEWPRAEIKGTTGHFYDELGDDRRRDVDGLVIYFEALG